MLCLHPLPVAAASAVAVAAPFPWPVSSTGDRQPPLLSPSIATAAMPAPVLMSTPVVHISLSLIVASAGDVSASASLALVAR